ncbi:uncharacterized protein LOC143870057 [Tasmannia lanceolata]|uniref:uncharacterized protein LOC143870057 n=1 Tax=Tasmannia lanceolata TaxID=3420 RepID=UPI0040646148
MKILSWNINGLGSQEKRIQVKEVVRRMKPDLICLQETKLEVINWLVIRSLGVKADWDFVFVASSGASGDILILWDKISWKKQEEWRGKFSLSVSLRKVVDNSMWLFSGVYGPVLKSKKGLFWEELGRRANQYIRDFADFIAMFELVDLPLSGASFTWSRGQSRSRLDHFLLSQDWVEAVPEVYQKVLAHSVSDHCPLVLDPRLESWGPPPFRFEIVWLRDPCMEENLGGWWASCHAEGPDDVVIGKKLRYVKKKLKEWVKVKKLQSFGRKQWLEKRILELVALEESGLDSEEDGEELGRVKLDVDTPF